MNSAKKGCLAFAITGGVGCGKSTVAHVLSQYGVCAIDADDVAREVVSVGSACLAAVVDRFGAYVLAENGALDRDRLARIVFADRDALAALNAIVHPCVYEVIERWVGECRAHRRDCAAVIPLLYETNASGEWDFVVCVSSTDDVSQSRLRLRGWSDEAIDQRRAAQWNIEEKKKRADVNIENNGSLEELAATVRETWKEICRRRVEHD